VHTVYFKLLILFNTYSRVFLLVNKRMNEYSSNGLTYTAELLGRNGGVRSACVRL